MKKILLLLALPLFAATLWAPVSLHAQTDLFKDVCEDNPNAAACQNRSQTATNNDIYGEDSLLARVTGLLAMVVGIASVIMIVVGGIMYVLSTGDATNINNAKNTIIYALVGLAIAGIAQMLVVFVIRRVT